MQNKNIYVRYNNEAGCAEAHQTMDPANYKGTMPNTGNNQRLMNTYIKKTLQPRSVPLPHKSLLALSTLLLPIVA